MHILGSRCFENHVGD